MERHRLERGDEIRVSPERKRRQEEELTRGGEKIKYKERGGAAKPKEKKSKQV